MTIEKVTPVLNVASLPESFAWFEPLGWKRGFTWNDGGLIAGSADRNEHGQAEFGSVCVDGATIFLCQDGQGQRGSRQLPAPNDSSENAENAENGMWMSWWIDSIESLDALHDTAVELGYVIAQPPTDEPWGVREFHLRHPDGHIFRVSCGLGE